MDSLDGTVRCPWAEQSDPERDYHDDEWGVPLHDDRLLFEFLILEGAQAGLSWSTILRKRENYRQAMAGFHPEKLATFGEKEKQALLQDPGIVRNRLKIESAIKNARAFLAIRDTHGSFADYIWQFTDGKTILNHWKQMDEVPAETTESQAMSRDLKKRGFNFVGPTICYAYMQAVGMVNDHLIDCFRYNEV